LRFENKPYNNNFSSPCEVLNKRASAKKFPGGGQRKKKDRKSSKKTPKNSTFKPLFGVRRTRRGLAPCAPRCRHPHC